MGAQFGDGFKVKDAVVSMSGPVFGWFVGGEKGAVRTQNQQGSGHEKGETRARGENALDEARRETCEGKLNQVDNGHSEAIVMH
ncbi:hypothetical protein FOXG_18152 [Fusarium oxysporum f. sp. lycopersici 4287]|uniref:Uncharacterized protein n=5 Tax=Fusarium oxysporum species complex TaxID=171631 RepID=W9J315_FUSOX|nr:hypothetical protein FOXG_18152 [Fusarium oxysporum f. sp. lycopersici 4287]EWY99181.1 hypothetical protein FOYG_03313 [Fusarium oxysporum NRRL 32931]EXK42655.1 hypothetical protein FOMG_05486 [Fusarium oxysporum f. sp. melonis 26406]KNA96460.1 hypothetical protein FOXG_18152 [Fusarium oxysporum f. sp. lycopersici 4287]